MWLQVETQKISFRMLEMYFYPKYSGKCAKQTVDPDQTAPKGPVLSGSVLFAIQSVRSRHITKKSNGLI